MKKLMLCIALSAVFLVGCERPRHIVVDNGDMVVYSVKRIDEPRGTYEYWVHDKSKIGWVLITDRKYDVGDVLEVVSTKKAEDSK